MAKHDMSSVDKLVVWNDGPEMKYNPQFVYLKLASEEAHIF